MLSFFNSILRTGARKKLAKKKTASYKEVRAASNLPTNFINLTFTGEMFKSLQAILVVAQLTKSVVKIEGITARSKKLLVYNSLRFGDLLLLSKLEQDQLAKANKNRILKVIKKRSFKILVPQKTKEGANKQVKAIFL